MHSSNCFRLLNDHITSFHISKVYGCTNELEFCSCLGYYQALELSDRLRLHLPTFIYFVYILLNHFIFASMYEGAPSQHTLKFEILPSRWIKNPTVYNNSSVKYFFHVVCLIIYQLVNQLIFYKQDFRQTVQILPHTKVQFSSSKTLTSVLISFVCQPIGHIPKVLIKMLNIKIKACPCLHGFLDLAFLDMKKFGPVKQDEGQCFVNQCQNITMQLCSDKRKGIKPQTVCCISGGTRTHIFSLLLSYQITHLGESAVKSVRVHERAS